MAAQGGGRRRGNANVIIFNPPPSPQPDVQQLPLPDF